MLRSLCPWRMFFRLSWHRTKCVFLYLITQLFSFSSFSFEANQALSHLFGVWRGDSILCPHTQHAGSLHQCSLWINASLGNTKCRSCCSLFSAAGRWSWGSSGDLRTVDDALCGVKSLLGCKVFVALVFTPRNLPCVVYNEAVWVCLLVFLSCKKLLLTKNCDLFAPWYSSQSLLDWYFSSGRVLSPPVGEQ